MEKYISDLFDQFSLKEKIYSIATLGTRISRYNLKLMRPVFDRTCLPHNVKQK